MDGHTYTWQLLLIDGLFLLLAGSMGLWFRAWLAREKGEMDRRLQGLEARQAELERISGRLQAVCRSLEILAQREHRQEEEPPAAPESNFERARELLVRGMPPGEVARRLDMGLAEVELVGRMLRHRRG